MKYIIVDNEVRTQKNLCELVQKLQPEWKAEAMFTDIESTVNWIQGNAQPDLIFMNVQLIRKDNGLYHFNQTCTESSIILTAPKQDDALRLLESKNIDYVWKPVESESLKPILSKYEKLNGTRVSLRTDIVEIANIVNENKKIYAQSFPLSCSGRSGEVHIDEVAYFYSMNKITFAVTKNKREHILDISLEKVAEQLNPEIFFRTNRQTICHRDAIKEHESWFSGKVMVTTEPEYFDKIIISRAKAKVFREWYASA